MAADTVIDPGAEIQDSRKRPLDGEIENGICKKSHYVGGGDGTYHFKILVPSVAAGAIIGKGGESIAQLQKETGARVKMSKANDFYPGTTERVCLITGNIDAVSKVLSFVMEKIKEKPDPNAKPAIDFDNKVAAEREKQVKILVPNSTAGMIIGKGGTYIKQIKEESGAYVQVSQKAKDQALAERCITVIGESEVSRKACMMILSKIVEDPQSGSCLNVSYADVTGPVANFSPTGSPYANAANGVQASSSPNGSVGNLHVPDTIPGSSGPQVNVPLHGANLTLSLNLNGSSSSRHSSLNSSIVDNLKGTLRGSGYSEQAASEITSAMNTLVSYGILNLGVGVGGVSVSPGSAAPPAGMNITNIQGTNIGMSQGVSSNFLSTGSGPIAPLDTVHTSPNVPTTNPVPNAGPFGPIGTVSSNALSTALGSSGQLSVEKIGSMSVKSDGNGFDPFSHASPPALTSPISNTNLPMNNNSFGLGTQPSVNLPIRKSPTPTEMKADISKVDIEIGENIVGAILGPGGKSLVEIQHLSGATIQISKKGNYAPGTRNRIVTITGTPNVINTAQYLIEQKISEEEAKRSRQSALNVLQ